MFTPELVQILLAISTAVITGLASYFAAQRGVAVALARHDVRIETLEKRHEEHHEEDSGRFKEINSRLLDIERGIRHRP